MAKSSEGRPRMHRKSGSGNSELIFHPYWAVLVENSGNGGSSPETEAME